MTRAKRENIDGFRVFIVDINLILCFDRLQIFRPFLKSGRHRFRGGVIVGHDVITRDRKCGEDLADLSFIHQCSIFSILLQTQMLTVKNLPVLHRGFNFERDGFDTSFDIHRYIALRTVSYIRWLKLVLSRTERTIHLSCMYLTPRLYFSPSICDS